MVEFPAYFINNLYLYFDNDMPKYLLDSNKQLLLGQLFDFQIHHICEHLKIPFINEFGINFPNKLLLDQIKEYDFKTFPKDCDTCKQIGLGYYPKQRNKFSLQNIGGKIVQPIELTVSQNFLTITQLPIFEQSIEIVPIDLPIDNRFLIDVSLKKIKEKAPLLKDFVDSKDKRIKIGMENIKKTKNKIEKLGKINYSENSSYIDVILMLFIVPIENSAFSNIFDIGPRIPKIKKDFISTHFKNKLNKKELISKIIELNKTLNSYKEKIFSGEIINSQLFRITLQTNFNQPGILTHPYYLSKNSFPIFDFYKDILKLNIINTQSFTTLNKCFIHPDNPTIFSGNIDIPQEDILHIVQEQTDEPGEHICLEIKGDILKYLVTRDTYKLSTDNREFLCPICNEFISKFDKTHMKFHRSNKIVFNQILEIQLDLNKIERVNGISPQEYQRVVYQYSIYNAKSISFHINRFEKRINKQSHMEEPNFVYEIPVFLEEVITDKNDNNYKLKAIITQTTFTTHLLFFCVNEMW